MLECLRFVDRASLQHRGLTGSGAMGRGGDALNSESIAGIARAVHRLALHRAVGQLDQPHTGRGRCEGNGWGPAGAER